MTYYKPILLKEISQIQVGYAIRTKIQKDPNGSIFILQMKDVQPEAIFWNDLARITPKGRKAPYLLQKGDIIFSGRGTKIFSQAITIEPKSIIVGSQFFILSPKEESLSEYISWYINSAQGQKYFWTYAGGSLIINVTRSIIEDFPIPIPPKSELKTITSIIRAMKRESEISTKLNIKRQKLIEAIISEKQEVE